MILEEGSSWDMVSENDIWEGGNLDGDQVEYVLVRQEDIVEGIACFMAAYLLSLEQTKVLSSSYYHFKEGAFWHRKYHADIALFFYLFFW